MQIVVALASNRKLNIVSKEVQLHYHSKLSEKEFGNLYESGETSSYSAKYVHVNFVLLYCVLCLTQKQIPFVVCTCTATMKES